MAETLGIGERPCAAFIARSWRNRGVTPRERDMPETYFAQRRTEYEGLGSNGMMLKETVRNVIDFGAFVDIGVHPGRELVHISQASAKKFVKHLPLEVVSVRGYRGCRKC